MSEPLVDYEGCFLSVLEKPPRNCQAVITARVLLLGTVDLNGFLFHMGSVGKFIRIAYNGVAGDADLQIAVRELGVEIAELCDDSGLTIGKFRTTADSYVTDLVSAYKVFLDDMEEMAFTSIESVGDSAKQVANVAEKFCKRFKDEREKVLQVCKTTAKKKEKEMEVDSGKHAKDVLKIPALHGAVGALFNLATIMTRTAIFWNYIQQMCEEQCNGKLEVLLDTAKKYENREKRLKVYRSPAIKKRMLKMYVSWMAMESVCDNYIKKIKVSREELYSYLCENPTFEESKARTQLLCREFKEQIEMENAKIAEQMKKRSK